MLSKYGLLPMPRGFARVMAKFISLSSGTLTASSSGVCADEETEARAGRCLALKLGAVEIQAERRSGSDGL